MSMSITLGELETIDNKLSAEYQEKSKKVLVTEYIDSLLSGSITEFKAYENDEEIIYQEIDEKNINTLSSTIKDLLLSSIENIKKNTEKNKDMIMDHIYDLAELNGVFMEYYKSHVESNKSIKIIII